MNSPGIRQYLYIFTFLGFTVSAQPLLAGTLIGQVVAWGDVGITYVEPGTKFAKIAAGADHNLALSRDGQIAGWGQNWSGQVNIPAGLSNVLTIATGYNHSLALKRDGTVAI